MLQDLLGWDPFFAEFDRVAQRAFDSAAVTASRQPVTSLPTDVIRREDALYVFMDLPGADWQDLDVSVEGRVLTVSATREPAQREGDIVFLRSRPHGRLRQQFALPAGLDADGVEASYDQGVLALRIPIAAAARRRRIEIGNWKQGKEIAAS